MGRLGENFELGAFVSRGTTADIYKASPKAGPGDRELLAKVVSLPDYIDKEGEEAEHLRQNLLDPAQVQSDLVAKGARHWLPIRDFGQTPEGVYYVADATDEKAALLWNRQRLGPAEIWDIIHGVVNGLQELEHYAKRPHGNLKRANVLLQTRKGKAGGYEVFLTDPHPNYLLQPKYHADQDLRAIGEMIYAFVKRVPFPPQGTCPPPDSPDWKMFGSKAQKWGQLCNRLLHPDLAGQNFTLEDAAELVAELEPKSGSISRIVKVVCNVLCVLVPLAALAAGAWFFLVRDPMDSLRRDYDEYLRPVFVQFDSLDTNEAERVAGVLPIPPQEERARIEAILAQPSGRFFGRIAPDDMEFAQDKIPMWLDSFQKWCEENAEPYALLYRNAGAEQMHYECYWSAFRLFKEAEKHGVAEAYDIVRDIFDELRILIPNLKGVSEQPVESLNKRLQDEAKALESAEAFVATMKSATGDLDGLERFLREKTGSILWEAVDPPLIMSDHSFADAAKAWREEIGHCVRLAPDPRAGHLATALDCLQRTRTLPAADLPPQIAEKASEIRGKLEEFREKVKAHIDRTRPIQRHGVVIMAFARSLEGEIAGIAAECDRIEIETKVLTPSPWETAESSWAIVRQQIEEGLERIPDPARRRNVLNLLERWKEERKSQQGSLPPRAFNRENIRNAVRSLTKKLGEIGERIPPDPTEFLNWLATIREDSTPTTFPSLNSLWVKWRDEILASHNLSAPEPPTDDVIKANSNHVNLQVDEIRKAFAEAGKVLSAARNDPTKIADLVESVTAADNNLALVVLLDDETRNALATALRNWAESASALVRDAAKVQDWNHEYIRREGPQALIARWREGAASDDLGGHIRPLKPRLALFAQMQRAQTLPALAGIETPQEEPGATAYANFRAGQTAYIVDNWDHRETALGQLSETYGRWDLLNLDAAAEQGRPWLHYCLDLITTKKRDKIGIADAEHFANKVRGYRMPEESNVPVLLKKMDSLVRDYKDFEEPPPPVWEELGPSGTLSAIGVNVDVSFDEENSGVLYVFTLPDTGASTAIGRPKPHALFFRKATSGDAISFLSTTETTFRLFRDVAYAIVNASDGQTNIRRFIPDPGGAFAFIYKYSDFYRNIPVATTDWLSDGFPGPTTTWSSRLLTAHPKGILAESYPMSHAAPQNAGRIAEFLGCRLPTENEWRAAMGEPSQREFNLGGRELIDKISELDRELAGAVWPQEGAAFWVGAFQPPAPLNLDHRDNHTFFRPTEQLGPDGQPVVSVGEEWRVFRDLLGNFWEIVTDDAGGAFKAVGYSALTSGPSRADLSPEDFSAYPIPPTTRGFSDMGFRLALDYTRPRIIPFDTAVRALMDDAPVWLPEK